ncbi:MAG: M48 family metalloprotease [Croceibacterium sp.]
MLKNRSSLLKNFALRGAAASALLACAAAPVIAQAQGTAITQSEAQQGAQYHPELLRQYGGAMSGPQAAYVGQVGRNIAVQSGLANSQSAFTVTLLNSSVDNAFAIPGGYVYVTRQLAALMNNEAELAGVLGHEIGHVAARHQAKREQAATRNSLLGGLLGAVLGGVLGNSGIGQLGQQLVSTGTQLATLKYSRSQETEADSLGIRYLRGAGYDPHAMGTVLADLAAQNSLDSQLQGKDSSSVPQWASTHPDPASRVQAALRQAGTATGLTNRDTYLTRMDGLLYGDDPHQGVIEGNTFIHPDMRITFTAPSGFSMVNGGDAVSISGQSGKAQLSALPYNGDLESYVRQAFQAIGGSQTQLAPQTLQRTTINGIPAVIGQSRVSTSSGQVDVTVVGYEFSSGQAYHFAALSPAGRSSVFNPMFNSLRRISPAEAARVVPRKIRVITARPGDSVQSLAGAMAYPSGQEVRFRVLNGLSGNAQVTPGQKYKLVVRG